MQNSSRRNARLEEIQRVEKQLDFTHTFFLGLMFTQGIIAGSKAGNEFLGSFFALKIIVEVADLLTKIAFVSFNVRNVNISHVKKLDQLKLKAQELQDEEKISAQEFNILQHDLANANFRDFSSTMLAYFCLLMYSLLSGFSIFLGAKDKEQVGALCAIPASAFFILAVLLTLSNKLLGDRLLQRVETEHVSPEAETQPKVSLLGHIRNYFFSKPEEETQPLASYDTETNYTYPSNQA